MRQLIPIVALALSASALAVAFLRSPEPTESPAAAAPQAGTSDDLGTVEELEERIRYLEGANDQLARRITYLERRPAVMALDGGAVPVPEAVASEVAELRAEVRSMIAGEALHSEGGKQYLREAVREVQQQLEEERRVQRMERVAQREEAAAGERAERWKRFASEAQLDWNQEQELTRRMALEEERRRALMEALRSGSGDPRSMRQEMRALRQETDAAMQQTLSAEQFQQYQQTRREDRRGGGGGGRDRQRP